MKTLPWKQEIKAVQLYAIQAEAETFASCFKCFQTWENHKAGNPVKSKQDNWDSHLMEIVFL